MKVWGGRRVAIAGIRHPAGLGRPPPPDRLPAYAHLGGDVGDRMPRQYQLQGALLLGLHGVSIIFTIEWVTRPHFGHELYHTLARIIFQLCRFGLCTSIRIGSLRTVFPMWAR
mgnify:CR=1 FL=1